MKLERKFGEDVEGYSIPVLNEREVRAAAGLFFVVLLVAATQVIDKQNFAMLKYSIVFFLFDFILRVLVNPRYAPSMILGRLLVKNQTPEYVGAPQKKFAWIIGLFLATVMFVHMVILNGYSPITGFSCMFCLIFLFFESAFGICLGCKVYHLVYKTKALYCPGEVCEIKSRKEIQKVSGAQILIVLGSVLFMVLVGVMHHENLQKKPYDIFGLESHTQTK
jgi:hypothetical protein